VNQLFAQGVNDNTGAGVTQDVATATAIVLHPQVNCVSPILTPVPDASQDMDGVLDNHVLLAVGSANIEIQVSMIITNSGDVDLNVSLSGLPTLYDCAALAANPANPGLALDFTTPFFLAHGATRTIQGCLLVSCPEGLNFTVSGTGTATATNTATTLVACIFNSQGNPITTPLNSQCGGSVTCQTPVTCRTTGGGTLYPNVTDTNCTLVVTELFDPAADALGLVVDHISHGGQIGAPFSHQDCGQILGDPCIRGEWEHVRHYDSTPNGNQDVIDMSFHTASPSTNNVKSAFDTLMCACLGCCSFDDVNQPNGNFTGVAKKFTLCNPDDHRVCGPMPRPAPANALISTGIGTFTPQITGLHGKKAEKRYVVFRIYIEDRSEPGGFHPKGAIDPADVYVFQAWDTGISVVKKPDYNSIWPDFRRALAADSCAFIQSISTPSQIVNNQVVTGVPPGTLPADFITFNGAQVHADISDKGPLFDGNRQIHPSTGATCTEP
jgi:hypothetical protein